MPKPSNYWQFAAVCQFFMLFDSFKLDLSSFSPRLEQELEAPTTWLLDLHIILLKHFYKSRNTRLAYSNIIFYVRKEGALRDWARESLAFLLHSPDLKYDQLDLEQRITLLHFLTELQVRELRNIYSSHSTLSYHALSSN
jgi:hypothetical protein